MNIENFRLNNILIEEGRKTDLYLFIVESDKDFKNDFKYKDLFYLVKLDSVELDFLNTGVSNPFTEEIRSKITFIKENYKGIKNLQNKNYYIAIIRVVDFALGEALSPHDILQDLLNIFALYWGTYFKYLDFSFISSLGFNLSDIVKNREFEEIPELNHNIEIFTQLREEQFYFIQKCLRMFNLSLKIANLNVSLGMSLLVSSVESLSQKYQWADMRFENQNFGKFLTELFREQDTIEDDIKQVLFEEIEREYMKDIYRVNANFIKLCNRVLKGTPRYNELTEKMFKNLYKERSQFLHVGEEKLNSRTRNWMFNSINDSKTGLKLFQHKDGNLYTKIIRIPAYNIMKEFIQGIITLFVNYLHSVHDSVEDKERYYELIYKKDRNGNLIKDENDNPIIEEKIGDFKTRNIIKIVAQQSLMPGMAVMEDNVHREIDSLDLDRFRIFGDQIAELINQGNYDQAIERADIHINSYFFTMEYEHPRRILLLKIVSLLELKKYDEAIILYEQNEINEINNQTHEFFNVIALIYASKEEFERAHRIIDELLVFVENMTEQSNEYKNFCLFRYTASKGEFFQMQELYQEAINFYEKSLSNGEFPHNEEIRRKITDCRNFLD